MKVGGTVTAYSKSPVLLHHAVSQKLCEGVVLCSETRLFCHFIFLVLIKKWISGATDLSSELTIWYA